MEFVFKRLTCIASYQQGVYEQNQLSKQSFSSIVNLNELTTRFNHPIINDNIFFNESVILDVKLSGKAIGYTTIISTKDFILNDTIIFMIYTSLIKDPSFRKILESVFSNIDIVRYNEKDMAVIFKFMDYIREKLKDVDLIDKPNPEYNLDMDTVRLDAEVLMYGRIIKSYYTQFIIPELKKMYDSNKEKLLAYYASKYNFL